MTEQKKGEQDTYNPEEALSKIDKERFPKLYEATQKLVESRKAGESLKVRAERAERKAKQASAKPEGDKTPKKEEKKEGFDYGQKAFLKASDIAPDEYPLVQEYIENTGKELDEVVESKHFQNELKDLREQKASAEAMPKGTKRSGGSGKDKVDYWIAKGEMPPVDQPMLRREYVNAKAKRETDTSKFTEQPVIK